MRRDAVGLQQSQEALEASRQASEERLAAVQRSEELEELMPTGLMPTRLGAEVSGRAANSRSARTDRAKQPRWTSEEDTQLIAAVENAGPDLRWATKDLTTLERVFVGFDRTGDSTVDTREFRRALEEVKLDFDDKEVRMLFDRFDKIGDEVIPPLELDVDLSKGIFIAST